ncbi:MAG: hypothetical protein D6691_01430 [Candidatus Hydrogenedentota bacterium]|uniref:Uncharacterized protein n=1 Tax=Sumerlaea chitinivorans TaxID=2250252 RepID=A0A2Z4Y3K1_SUMC1|nr:hypothetical protein BRCON_0258 [Candidatus Sumerlaea chitinivorans]RMH30267.1 MAG: hypothetical protein D6691_01430 [Candidatus Hydrogenedentota bacterium]
MVPLWGMRKILLANKEMRGAHTGHLRLSPALGELPTGFFASDRHLVFPFTLPKSRFCNRLELKVPWDVC